LVCHTEGVKEWRAEEDIRAQRDDVQGSAKDCTMRSFIIHTPHQMLFG